MKQKLYRSRQEKMIAGVCGGIAEHFDTDPIWIRLIAVLLALADGVGIILYIIAWIFIPENPKQKSTKKTAAEETVKKLQRKKSKSNSFVFGLILVIIGLYFLFDNLFPWFSSRIAWPLLIIGVGLYFLIHKK